ncbi:MAG TPA: hypothetical protein VJU86_17620 [Pyrinomonadaceae bacterium]|nr:hypothetical protein [Pyrinomonadaceae bacterium]
MSHVTGQGCQSCGAHPVGDALPRPDHELPSFGRSLVLAVTGSLLVLIFVVQTVSSFTQKLPTEKTTKEAFYAAGAVAFDYLRWLSAAETAAWQLKWLMIPVTLGVLFGSRRLYRSIVAAPARFCGRRAALRGYLASAAIPLLVLVLIGVTVPERLRQRNLGIEAGFRAHGHRVDRAYTDYQKEYETLPSHLNDLKRLPDPDGSLAAALATLDENGYKPSADLAAAPTKKPRPLRGAVIMNASSETADDVPTERISFTNYELQMPGPDKVLGTEDDLIMRDGLITKASETPRRLGSTTGAAKATKR